MIEAQNPVSAKVGQILTDLAAVVDDGQPSGGSLVTRWSVIAGDPEEVWIEDAGDPATAILISRSGFYSLRLDAADGERRSAVTLAITVTPTGTVFTLQ